MLEESDRLAALNATQLLDSPAESDFDQFTRMATKIAKTPVALVSLVDEGRQFFKSCVGLPEPWASDRQTPLSHSFCQHVVNRFEPLCIKDAREDPLVCDNLAIQDLGVVAYLGIPLTTSSGHTLGSFCVIDTEPREWDSDDVELIRQLASLVVEKIELRTSARQLLAEHMRLRGLEVFRDQSVQMLVHDLRSPLTAVLGGIEMTQESGGLSVDERESLATAMEGGEMMLSMINRMLEACRDERGEVELRLVRTSSVRLFDAVCKQLAPLAAMAGVKLGIASVEDVAFEADVVALNRVLVNLISNAIQHTPSGGEISLSSDRSESSVIKMTVADTGHGIPAADHERIFERFEAGNTPKESGASTGLGLAYSRLIVEAHGGKIWVESAVGKGSQFHLTIPLRRD